MVHPEFVHGIASGAPVPLKGAAVLRVTLLEGKTPETARPGSRQTSDWHGLILGGRDLDCAGRMGLGFRPGPETHVLDTLAVQIPRCEDLTRTRKDRAYAFEARLSSLDDSTSREPGGEDREFLRFDGESPCSSPLGMASSCSSGGMRRRPPTALCRRWFSQRSAALRRSRGSALFFTLSALEPTRIALTCFWSCHSHAGFQHDCSQLYLLPHTQTHYTAYWAWGIHT